MITLYLNHYRGFEDTFIPLDDVTFLVGENSTGKTSVLTALRALSADGIWALGRFQLNDEVVGGFSDFASNGVAWFQIGYFRRERGEKTSYDAVLLTFAGRGSNIPWVMDVRLRSANTDVHFHWDGDDLSFEKKPASGSVEEGFRAWTKLEPSSSEGLSAIDVDGPNPHTPMGMITGLFAHESASYNEQMDAYCEASDTQAQKVTALAHAAHSGIGASVPEVPPLPARPSFPSPFPFDLSWTGNLEWLAPIRAKPRRSYNSVAESYSPEGEHIPWTLRSLSERSKLRERLRDFGTQSGLYDDVGTQGFGDTEDAPFEVRVRLGDRTPNLINVGYGVSQVLPVVASVLNPSSRGAWFALQQPEVHLHPRAQAALGDQIFEMALPPHNKRFLIETHSDYVVDRFRFRMREAGKTGPPLRAQVLFFERVEGGNIVHRLPLAEDGEYPKDQPEAFRAFFLTEELQNLGY